MTFLPDLHFTLLEFNHHDTRMDKTDGSWLLSSTLVRRSHQLALGGYKSIIKKSHMLNKSKCSHVYIPESWGIAVLMKCQSGKR